MGADVLIEQARRHEAAGRYERALQCYRSAIQRHQGSEGKVVEPALYLSLADLHFRGGEPVRALQNYRLAAQGYRDKGLPRNAVSLHKMSRRLFPDRAEPYVNLILAFLRDGRESEADEILDELAAAMAENESLDFSKEEVDESVDSAGPEVRERLEEAFRQRPQLVDLLT